MVLLDISFEQLDVHTNNKLLSKDGSKYREEEGAAADAEEEYRGMSGINFGKLLVALKKLIASSEYRPYEKAVILGRDYLTPFVVNGMFKDMKNTTGKASPKSFFVYCTSEPPLRLMQLFSTMTTLNSKMETAVRVAAEMEQAFARDPLAAARELLIDTKLKTSKKCIEREYKRIREVMAGEDGTERRNLTNAAAVTKAEFFSRWSPNTAATVRSADSTNLTNRRTRFLVLFYAYLVRTGTRLPERFNISDEELADHYDESFPEIGGALMRPLERMVYEDMTEDERQDFNSRVADKRFPPSGLMYNGRVPADLRSPNSTILRQDNLEGKSYYYRSKSVDTSSSQSRGGTRRPHTHRLPFYGSSCTVARSENAAVDIYGDAHYGMNLDSPNPASRFFLENLMMALICNDAKGVASKPENDAIRNLFLDTIKALVNNPDPTAASAAKKNKPNPKLFTESGDMLRKEDHCVWYEMVSNCDGKRRAEIEDDRLQRLIDTASIKKRRAQPRLARPYQVPDSTPINGCLFDLVTTLTRIERAVGRLFVNDEDDGAPKPKNKRGSPKLTSDNNTISDPVLFLTLVNLAIYRVLDLTQIRYYKEGNCGDGKYAAPTPTHHLTVNFPLLKGVNVFDPLASFVDLTTDQYNVLATGVCSIVDKSTIALEDLLFLRLEFDETRDMFAGMGWMATKGLAALSATRKKLSPPTRTPKKRVGAVSTSLSTDVAYIQFTNTLNQVGRRNPPSGSGGGDLSDLREMFDVLTTTETHAAETKAKLAAIENESIENDDPANSRRFAGGANDSVVEMALRHRRNSVTLDELYANANITGFSEDAVVAATATNAEFSPDARLKNEQYRLQQVEAVSDSTDLAFYREIESDANYPRKVLEFKKVWIYSDDTIVSNSVKDLLYYSLLQVAGNFVEIETRLLTGRFTNKPSTDMTDNLSVYCNSHVLAYEGCMQLSVRNETNATDVIAYKILSSSCSNKSLGGYGTIGDISRRRLHPFESQIDTFLGANIGDLQTGKFLSDSNGNEGKTLAYEICTQEDQDAHGSRCGGYCSFESVNSVLDFVADDTHESNLDDGFTLKCVPPSTIMETGLEFSIGVGSTVVDEIIDGSLIIGVKPDPPEPPQSKGIWNNLFFLLGGPLAAGLLVFLLSGSGLLMLWIVVLGLALMFLMRILFGDDDTTTTTTTTKSTSSPTPSAETAAGRGSSTAMVTTDRTLVPTSFHSTPISTMEAKYAAFFL